MEDKHICKGKYIYQFRVDLSENRWSDIENFIERENFVKYLGKFEIGQKTKKPHFQGVLWKESPMDDNEKNKIRAYWKKDDHLKYRNSISITTVKKPESICKYVTKDKGKCYTNLNKEEMSQVGTWQPMDKEVEPIMREWVKENNHVYVENVYGEYNKYATQVVEHEFVEQYFKVYYKITGDLPTSRHKWKIWKMMYKLQVVPLKRYIEECRIII